MKESQLPETLCRITWNSYLLDWEGYLIPHYVEKRMMEEDFLHVIPQREVAVHKPRLMKPENEVCFPGYRGFNYRSTSLVHPDEWETIARYMYEKPDFKKHFRLLTVKTSEIERLIQEKHPSLYHSEYFGHLHQSDIISDVGYQWIESDKPIFLPEEGFRFLSGETEITGKDFLSLSVGYHPVPV